MIRRKYSVSVLHAELYFWYTVEPVYIKHSQEKVFNVRMFPMYPGSENLEVM